MHVRMRWQWLTFRNVQRCLTLHLLTPHLLMTGTLGDTSTESVEAIHLIAIDLAMGHWP
jgi:hypothetical protein